MRYLWFAIVLSTLVSCSNENNSSEDVNENEEVTEDTIKGKREKFFRQDDTSATEKEKEVPDQVYSNQRFRKVTAEKVGENSYRIRGEGQIFEASFGWVVEDGHNELKEGYEMTDAGAPAWGKFDFTINVEKQRPNSTLTLILFETSAKDGRRVYELPVKLS